MTLKHYIPTSIAIFATVILTARYFAVPAAPFALVLVLGETLIGLQMEDQRIGRFLEDLWSAVKFRPHDLRR